MSIFKCVGNSQYFCIRMEQFVNLFCGFDPIPEFVDYVKKWWGQRTGYKIFFIFYSFFI